MSENNNDMDLTQQQAVAGFTFQMALAKINEQNRLDELFAQMKIGNHYASHGTESALEKFQADFDPKNAAASLEVVKTTFPDIYSDILKEIESKQLDKDLEGTGLEATDFTPEALDTLKTVKAFEDQFPDSKSPPLKDRLILIKDKLLEAKNTTGGKIVFNSVMLGVALGTGGVGAIAGIKLAHAVGEKLMQNEKVAELAGAVTSKVSTFMKDRLHIPLDEIREGVSKVKEKTEKTMGSKAFRYFALATMAVGAVALGVNVFNHVDLSHAKDLAASTLGSAVENGPAALAATPGMVAGGIEHIGDALGHAKDLASSGLHSAAQHLGFDSVDHPAGLDASHAAGVADTGTVPAPDTGTLPVPDGAGGGASIPTPASPTPDIGVAPSVADVTPAHATHIVAKHDTMWGVVKDALGPDASNTQIANGVKSLIDANPQIHNPDLIFPGDVLKVPEGLAHHLAAGPTGLDVGALKAAIDTHAMNPFAMPDVSFPVTGHQGLDVGNLNAAIDHQSINPLAQPTISFPSESVRGPVVEAATVPLTASELASSIKPLALDPSQSVSVSYPDLQATSIQPNAGAAAKLAELAKSAAPVIPKTKGIELSI